MDDEKIKVNNSLLSFGDVFYHSSSSPKEQGAFFVGG